MAADQSEVVRRVMAQHPEINTMKDGERGQITSLVVQALGGFPWGRKSKDGSATNLSDDALCYRVGATSFEIYDIINGSTGRESWDYKGTFRDGENGFFYMLPATPIDPGGPVKPADPTPAVPEWAKDLQARMQDISDDLSSVEVALNALMTNLAVKIDQVMKLKYRGSNRLLGTFTLEPVQ